MALFVGDLVDRGPRVLDTLRIVYNMMRTGAALTVMGNHEQKLVRALNGRNVKVTHGLGQSLPRSRPSPRTHDRRSSRPSRPGSTASSATSCSTAAGS